MIALEVYDIDKNLKSPKSRMCVDSKVQNPPGNWLCPISESHKSQVRVVTKTLKAGFDKHWLQIYACQIRSKSAHLFDGQAHFSVFQPSEVQIFNLRGYHAVRRLSSFLQHHCYSLEALLKEYMRAKFQLPICL